MLQPTRKRANHYAFWVPGRPVPAQRMTKGTKWTQRAQKSLEYQRLVAVAARAAGLPTILGPVQLTCRFFFRDGRHGDLSNLVKSVEDGLQYAGVLLNDRQVMRYGQGTGIYRDKNERAEVILEVLYEGHRARQQRVDRARTRMVGADGHIH